MIYITGLRERLPAPLFPLSYSCHFVSPPRLHGRAGTEGSDQPITFTPADETEAEGEA